MLGDIDSTSAIQPAKLQNNSDITAVLYDLLSIWMGFIILTAASTTVQRAHDDGLAG